MATLEQMRGHFANDEVRSMPLIYQHENGGRIYTAIRALPEIDTSRIAPRQERLRVDHGFVTAVYVSVALPEDASHAAGHRYKQDFAWSRAQWAALDASFFEEVEHLLAKRAKASAARNEQRRIELEEASASTIIQIQREQRILENTPTAEVDAWIIAHMGYTPERLAALGKATRRNRRREARQQMQAARE